MVRLKSIPEKSLYEVDYSHPSVVIWFFGQNGPANTTTTTNIGNHVVSTRGDANHNFPSKNSHNNTNGMTGHSTVSGNGYHNSNPQQTQNHHDKHTTAHRDLQHNNHKANHVPMNGNHVAVNNHNHSHSTSRSTVTQQHANAISTHSTSPVTSVTITLSPPAHMSSSAASGATSNNSGDASKVKPVAKSTHNASEQAVVPPAASTPTPVPPTPPLTHEKPVHPLSKVADVPPLADLQLLITEVIMSEGEGKSCPFDKIYDFISQRWKTIRRRDGSYYTTDCKRAIQANLRSNPNHIALFRKDKTKEGYWFVCTTLEEAAEASKENRRSRRDKDLENIKIEEDGDSSSDEERPQDDSKEEDHDEYVNEEGDGYPKLTELQSLVCECINDNSGSCHFDLIVHHVSKHWNSIGNKSGNTDVKSAILSTLTDSKQRLFKRDTKRTGWWMINSDVLTEFPQLKKEDDSSKTKGRRTRNSREQNELSSHDSSVDSSEANNTSGDEGGPRSRNENSITELQTLIIQAIDLEGGTANFEQIYDRVSKKFDSIKRRDGTPYTSDCKRAVQASLSNNPTTRPFFKKETRKGVTVWSLAKRSVDFLASLVLEQPKHQPARFETAGHEEEEEEESMQQATPSHSDSEEEIHDEELEEEEKRPAEEKEEKKEEPKEEKHLYANRVKRARKIKENAGKRNVESDSQTTPSKDRKKRRR